MLRRGGAARGRCVACPRARRSLGPVGPWRRGWGPVQVSVPALGPALLGVDHWRLDLFVLVLRVRHVLPELDGSGLVHGDGREQVSLRMRVDHEDGGGVSVAYESFESRAHSAKEKTALLDSRSWCASAPVCMSQTWMWPSSPGSERGHSAVDARGFSRLASLRRSEEWFTRRVIISRVSYEWGSRSSLGRGRETRVSFQRRTSPRKEATREALSFLLSFARSDPGARRRRRRRAC